MAGRLNSCDIAAETAAESARTAAKLVVYERSFLAPDVVTGQSVSYGP